MKHLLICLSLALALISGACAQTQSEQARRSDEIMKKMRQIDLLNQMLPLVMTKDQIGKILPVIEKARQKVRDEEKSEYKLMLEQEPKIDAAIKAGVEKGSVPQLEFIRDLNKVVVAMSISRDILANENGEAVLKVMKETLNRGQLKAAANSLNPKLFDPSIKVDEMTEDQKITFFVRNIMLDPQAYEMLVQLMRHAS